MTDPRPQGPLDGLLAAKGPPAEDSSGRGSGKGEAAKPSPNWDARLRGWGAKLGALVEALFPSPEPPPVPIPVPVRRRRR